MKYKEFFGGWIFFISLSPGLKIAPGSPIIYYYDYAQFDEVLFSLEFS